MKNDFLFHQQKMNNESTTIIAKDVKMNLHGHLQLHQMEVTQTVLMTMWHAPALMSMDMIL